VSFFTSLTYYRPTKPPLITGDGFSRFIQRIVDTGCVEKPGLTSLKVKFGRAIDQDRQGTSEPVMLMPGLYQDREIEWDIVAGRIETFGELIELVKGNTSRIYRAHMSFGSLSDGARLPITREPCEQNEQGFYPDCFGVSIGPVHCANMSTEGWRVGWIELCFPGNGYLYPWTLQDTVQRAQSSADIIQLCEICRSTWPVPSRRPSFLTVMRRKKFAELWPYDDFKKPYDWYWGVNETG
jgi:hypothetical protein